MPILRLRIATVAVVGAAAVLLFSTLAVESAFAQPIPDLIPDAKYLGPGEARPALPPRELEADDTPIPGRTLPRIQIPEDDGSASALSGGVIEIKAFHFSGNLALSDAELAVVTESYLGEGRRYSTVLEARDRVTRAYVDAGYISSGAVLPAQDFSDGVVEITIIEGQLTSIDVTTDGRLRTRYFTSRLEANGGTLNVNTLRESLRRLKRDPRITAVAAELIPGDALGESVLSIAVDEAVPYWASAKFDNYAPVSIGEYRGRFRAGHRNLSGWGDTWSVAYSVAEGLNDVDLRVEVPLNRWDTSLELWMRRAWSEIVEDVIADSFDIESKTQAYGFRLRQPVLRERGQEARIFFAGDWKRGRGYLAGEPGIDILNPNKGFSTVAVLRTGGDYLLRLKRRALAARITASVGLDVLGATPLRENAGEKFPDGKFVSGLLQVQAVEYLPWYDMRLQTRIDAQIADARLLGLEQYALGGHNTVRGTRENLLVRDQGVVGSIELRLPLPHPDPVRRLELGFFADGGYGRNFESSKSGVGLLFLGVGIHADIWRHVRIALEWAQKVEKTGGVTGDKKALQDDGLHISLLVRFP